MDNCNEVRLYIYTPDIVSNGATPHSNANLNLFDMKYKHLILL